MPCLALKSRDRIPVLAVIGSTDEAADLREAQDRCAPGYRAFKIKVGHAVHPSGRRANAGRLPDAQGERGEVSGLSRRQSGLERRAGPAVHRSRSTNDRSLDFFEQPVHAHDLAGMARVAAASRVPIGADEGHSFARRHRAASRAQGRGRSEPEGDQAWWVFAPRSKLAGFATPRHEGQHFLQDRRVERRFGGGAASRIGGPASRTGVDCHQSAALPRMSSRRTFAGRARPRRSFRRVQGSAIKVDERRVRRSQQHITRQEK